MAATRWCSQPANSMDRSAYAASADLHSMEAFPPSAIVFLTRIRVGFQQFVYACSQRCCFLWWPPGNRPRQNISGLTPLLQVTLDGRPRHLEAFDNRGSGCPFINCSQHLLSYILGIGSHASILSLGSLVLQAPSVNKVAVRTLPQRTARRGRLHHSWLYQLPPKATVPNLRHYKADPGK